MALKLNCSPIFPNASMGFTVIAILPLSACSPFVGYTHLDDTPFSNDDQAYDLACGGVKIEKGVEISAAWCENLNNDWSGVKIDVDYVWRK